MESKSYHRKKLIRNLDALDLSQKKIWDEQILQHLDKRALMHTEKIAVYFPLKREVNIWPFIAKLYLSYSSLLFPFFDFSSTNEDEANLYFHPLTLKNLTKLFELVALDYPLKHNYLNNLEFSDLLALTKAAKTLHLDLDEPDTIFVPCLGVNIDNFRLGYGGGYYDYYFSKRLQKFKHKNWKCIATVYPIQLQLNFDEKDYDLHIDEIITV